MKRLIQWLQWHLKPNKTIPITPWRANHTWDLGIGREDFERYLILFVGLIIFGLGESLLVLSTLGNSPWVVFAEGVSKNTNLNIGETTFLTSLVVLLLWIPFKQKPGFGTLMNIVGIATALEVGLRIVPYQDQVLFQILFVFLGIGLVGAGSALYITCGLGTGPRDGLMTGLHYKTGVRVGRVRLGIELVVLTIGAALGGTLGVGTALFALLIGQSVAVALGVVDRLTYQ